jgi:hypothetical protein
MIHFAASPTDDSTELNVHTLCTAIAALALALAQTSVEAAEGTEPKPLYPQDPGKVPERVLEQDARFKCFLENEARRKSCIDGTRIWFNDGLRSSELWVGRPERVRATGVYLVVDCKTTRTALRNRDGAPLTGEGLTISPEASRALSKEVCTLPSDASKSDA